MTCKDCIYYDELRFGDITNCDCENCGGFFKDKSKYKEVVRGEWKLYGNDDDTGMSYWCTACNFHLNEDLFYSGYNNGKWIENEVFKFCPNCGAQMKG